MDHLISNNIKEKTFLFVDGRYVEQAKIQVGKKFKILEIPKKLPSNFKFRIEFRVWSNGFHFKKLKYSLEIKIKLTPISKTILNSDISKNVKIKNSTLWNQM